MAFQVLLPNALTSVLASCNANQSKKVNVAEVHPSISSLFGHYDNSMDSIAHVQQEENWILSGYQGQDIWYKCAVRLSEKMPVTIVAKAPIFGMEYKHSLVGWGKK